MGAAAALAARQLEWLVSGATFFAQVVRLATSIGVALAVLAVAASLLKIREFRDGAAVVAGRFRRPGR
jgi:hypothetical protein